MAKVNDILLDKGSQVLSVGEEATVLDAAILMNDHRVGGLVVTRDAEVVGMFTERDVLRRVVAEQRDPARTRVGDVMTRNVYCCSPETTIEEARGMMMRLRIRHLPVVDAGGVVGLVSIGDLNAWQLNGQEKTIHFLEEYLYGRV